MQGFHSLQEDVRSEVTSEDGSRIFFWLRGKEILVASIVGRSRQPALLVNTAKERHSSQGTRMGPYALLSSVCCATGRGTHCTAHNYLCRGFVVLGRDLFDLGLIQKGRHIWLIPIQRKKKAMAKNHCRQVLPAMTI